MTLSIFWRREGRLHQASDSRVSFTEAGSTDIGVKAMRLSTKHLLICKHFNGDMF